MRWERLLLESWLSVATSGPGPPSLGRRMSTPQFLSAMGLRAHTDVGHVTEIMFKCTFEGCTYASIKPAYFDTHSRGHCGARVFPCLEPDCSAVYRGVAGLRAHTRAAHTFERAFKCTFEGCTYAGTSKYLLMGHRKRHRGGERIR